MGSGTFGLAFVAFPWPSTVPAFASTRATRVQLSPSEDSRTRRPLSAQARMARRFAPFMMAAAAPAGTLNVTFATVRDPLPTAFWRSVARTWSPLAYVLADPIEIRVVVAPAFARPSLRSVTATVTFLPGATVAGAFAVGRRSGSAFALAPAAGTAARTRAARHGTVARAGRSGRSMRALSRPRRPRASGDPRDRPGVRTAAPQNDEGAP